METKKSEQEILDTLRESFSLLVRELIKKELESTVEAAISIVKKFQINPVEEAGDPTESKTPCRDNSD